MIFVVGLNALWSFRPSALEKCHQLGQDAAHMEKSHGTREIEVVAEPESREVMEAGLCAYRCKALFHLKDIF